MKEIVIELPTCKHLIGTIDLLSDDLCFHYADIGHMHGLQASWDESDPRYGKLKDACFEIASAVRKVAALCDPENFEFWAGSLDFNSSERIKKLTTTLEQVCKEYDRNKLGEGMIAEAKEVLQG